MKYMNNMKCNQLVVYLLIIMSLITAASCNQKSENTGEISEISEPEYSFEVVCVISDMYNPMYRSDNPESEYIPTLTESVLLVKDASGNYLKFDNDADYSQFGSDVIVPFFFSFNSINRNFDRYTEYFIKNPKREDLIQTHKRDSELLDGVIKYMNGSKKAISNRNLFETIDRAYYNTHPDSWWIHLTRQSYGWKHYKDDSGEGFSAVKASEYCRTSSPRQKPAKFMNSNGDEVIIDDDVLILMGQL